MNRLPPAIRRRLAGLDDYLRRLLTQLPTATREEVLDAAAEWCDDRIDGSAIAAHGLDVAGDLLDELVRATTGPAGVLLGPLADRAVDAAAPAAGRWLEGLSDRQLARARAWLEVEVDRALAGRSEVTPEPPRVRVLALLRARAGGAALPGGLRRALVIAALRADEELRTALTVTPDQVEAAVLLLGAGEREA